MVRSERRFDTYISVFIRICVLHVVIYGGRAQKIEPSNGGSTATHLIQPGLWEEGKGAPKITLAEEKKVILKRGSVRVNVGTTVWAVRGTAVTVTCQASGKPQPTIKWYRDGFEVNRFEDNVGVVNGELVVRKVGRFNEGKYFCNATNTEGWRAAEFNLKIFSLYQPTILKAEGDFRFGPNTKFAEITIGSSVTVYRGSTLTIRCPNEATPKPTVYWSSHGRSIAVGRAKQVNNDIVITNIDKIFALLYTCTVRNFRGIATAKSKVNVLDLDPPKIKVAAKTTLDLSSQDSANITIGTDVKVMSGTSVTISCPIQSTPEPRRSWNVKGATLDPKDDKYQINADQSSLTLRDVDEHDSALYSCVATNNAGEDVQDTRITVLAPVLPRILHSKGLKLFLQGVDGEVSVDIGLEVTVLSSLSLIVRCRVEGQPTPKVFWERNGTRIPLGPNKRHVVRGNTLRISNMTRRDAGRYTCSATNTAGSVAHDSFVNVIESEMPKISSSSQRVVGLQGIEDIVVAIGEDLRVVEGVIVRLKCPVTGFPIPRVTWYKNDYEVVAEGRFLLEQFRRLLIIDGIQQDDTGQFSCVAENIVGRAEESTFISILSESSAAIIPGSSNIESVKSLDPVNIKIGDSLHVLSGSDVRVDCLANGTPLPFIRWRRNGQPVKSGDAGGQFVIQEITGGSQLITYQISKELQGNFECIATNVGGADRRISIISVLDAKEPLIETDTKNVISVSDLKAVSVKIGARVQQLEGSQLTLSCPATGVPEPVIAWFKRDDPVQEGERVSVVNDSLLIRKTEVSDSATYKCTATNVISQDFYISIVQVIGLIKPRIMETPRNVTVFIRSNVVAIVGGTILTVTSSSIELNCRAEGTPFPEISWRRGEVEIAKGRKFKIPDAQTKDSGSYTCVASSIAGQDTRTSELLVKDINKPSIQSYDDEINSLDEKPVAVGIGAKVTAVEGTEVSIVCSVRGFPQPTLVWLQDNREIDESFEERGFFVTSIDGNSSTLVIKGKQGSGDSAVYGCSARNDAGTVASYSRVIYRDLKPPKVQSTYVTGSVGLVESLESRVPVTLTVGDSAKVLTKTRVTILCPVFGLPRPKVTWTKGVDPLGESRLVNDTHLVLSSNNDVKHSGMYACTATNRLGTDTASSDVTYVEPTQPSILSGFASTTLLRRRKFRINIGSNITSVLNNNISISCKADGRPFPELSWHKDGKSLNFKGEQFNIYSTKVSDTGVYTCKATNLAGHFAVRSHVVILGRDAVQNVSKPKILTTKKNVDYPGDKQLISQVIGGNLTIIEGRDLVLTCPTEGEPNPSISWLLNGKQLEPSDTLEIDEVAGKLTVIEITNEEAGEYACVATNILGEATEVSFTTVIEPVTPVINSSNTNTSHLDPAKTPLEIRIGGYVETLTGTTVTIICEASGYPTPKITWARRGFVITLETDQRLLVNGSALTIEQPRTNDSAQYVCTASNAGGSVSAVTNIGFRESKKPRILTSSEDKDVMELVSMDFRIGRSLQILGGSNVTLKCEAVGIPLPQITWSKDGGLLDTTGSLFVLKATSTSDSGLYSCSASNIAGTVDGSSSVLVKEGREPRIVSSKKTVRSVEELKDINVTIGGNLTALAGSRVQLSCPVDGFPKPSTSWRRNGEVLESAEQSDGLFLITKLSADDQGTYSCSASNVFGIDSSSSYFTVLEPSEPRILASSQPKEIMQRVTLTESVGTSLLILDQSNVTLKCEASGLPKPRVSWSKDGSPLKHTGPLLEIPLIKLVDGGRYICTATNLRGADIRSTAVSVVVGEKPRVLASQDSISSEKEILDVRVTIGGNLIALEGSRVQLSCPSFGVPTPVLSWFRNGKPLAEADGVDESKAALIITDLSVDGQGRYTCTATNVLGSHSVSSYFAVLEPIKPQIQNSSEAKHAISRASIELTIGDSLTTLDRNNVTLKCKVQGIPTPRVTWTKDGVDIETSGESYVIRHIRSEDSGSYTCTAVNLLGSDSRTSRIIVKVGQKPRIRISNEVITSVHEFPPQLSVTIGDKVKALDGTFIRLDCTSTGFPNPTLSLSRNGEPLVGSDEVSLFGDTGSTGAAFNLSARYNGTFTCTASNALGSDEVSSVFVVVGLVPPKVYTSKRDIVVVNSMDPVRILVGENLTFLRGGDIIVECMVLSGVPRPVITWTKDGEDVPEEKRTGNALTLLKSETDDSGKYTCTVRNVAGKVNATSKITVIEPTIPTIKVSNRDITSMDKTPVSVVVGDSLFTVTETNVTLSCSADGQPIPKVTWTKGNETLPSDGRMVVIGGTLGIIEVQPSDSGLYVCTARSAGGVASANSRVTVVDTSRPQIRSSEVDIQVFKLQSVRTVVGSTVQTLTGNDVTLICVATGVPQPDIKWTSEGLSPVEMENLTISAATPANSGMYTCTAGNVVGSDTESTILEIIDPVPPTITTFSRNIEVLRREAVSATIGDTVTTLDGNNVTLVCDASGVPDPKVTWYGSDGAVVQSDGSSLVLVSVTPERSGTYSCRAVGLTSFANVSSKVSVRVGTKPVIAAENKNIVNLSVKHNAVTIGSNLTVMSSSGLDVSCPVTGFPKPVITWYRGNTTLKSGITMVIDEKSGKLTFLSISHRKSGTYTCVASSVLGISSASSVIEVTTATVPHINASRGHFETLENRDSVRITTGEDLTALTQTTLTIVCPVKGVPPPSTAWYKSDQILETGGRIIADGMRLIIKDAIMADMGRYLCKAKNLAGEATQGSNLVLIEPVHPRISSGVDTILLLRRGALVADVGSNVTTVSGNSLRLTCNVTGKPAPRIEWRKDALLRRIGSVDYTIASLSQEDSGIYTCSASNLLGSVEETSNIEVSVGIKPKIITLKENTAAINGENNVKIVVGGNLTTISGTEVEIFCPVEAFPEPMIAWWFNSSSASNRIPNGSPSISFSFGVAAADSGFYTCIANNSLGSDSQTTYMSVIVSVEPKIIHSQRQIKDYDQSDHELVIGDTLHTVVGSMVSISCKAVGNPPPEVTWTKGGLPIVTSPRTKEILNGTLVIHGGTWSDAGRYRCKATNVAGTDEKFTFLQFMPPSKPEIQEDKKVVESYTRTPVAISIGGSIKVLTNTAVTLICNASGIPVPSYLWQQSKLEGSTEQKLDIENELSVQLTIREVGVNDTGKYTCVATNIAGEDSATASLEVVEPVAPSIKSSVKFAEWYDNTAKELLIGTRVKTLSATKVILKCLASGFPEPKVTWRLGGHGVPNGQFQIIKHALIIAYVQAADSGHYTCVATSVVGTVSVTTELSVVEPQPPEIISSYEAIFSLDTRKPITADVGTDIDALVGTEVSLVCSATGVPSPRVMWSKQDRDEVQTLQEIAVNSSRTLVISNSTVRDNGRYQCTAISPIGVDMEETRIEFFEPVPPVIEAVSGLRVPLKNAIKTAVQVGSIANVRANTTVQITCPVSGLPTPSVTWTKDDKQVISGGRYFIDENGILTISRLSLEDSGQYVCIAVNIQGRDRLSGRLEVIETVPPRILSDPGTTLSLSYLKPVSVTVGGKLKALTNTQISLHCPVVGKPEPVISWRKDGQQITPGDRIHMDLSGTLTVKRARITDSGEYQCIARNVLAEVLAASLVSVIEPVHPTITSSKSYVIWYERQPFKAKIGDNLTTIKGRKVTIVCPAKGIPRPTITWYRAGERMHTDARHEIRGEKLIIDNLDVLDTDRYTCVAKNIAGMTFATTTLKVHEPVPPLIFSTYGQYENLRDRKPVNVTIGSDVALISGTPFIIKCPVRGVPMPKIIWAKDRYVLESSDRLDMDCNGTLRIHQVKTEDSGEYICTAENVLGMDMGFTTVAVYDSRKPQITTPEKPKDISIGDGDPVSMTISDNVTALLNTTISITCPVTGVPKPRVTWKKDGKVLKRDQNNSVDKSGTLTVKYARETAVYTCSLYNEAGTDSASSSIVVVAPVKPRIEIEHPDTNIPIGDGSPVITDVGSSITSRRNTSITIRCPSSGIPRPSVRWSKDGRDVAGEQGHEIQEDGSLVIERALTSGIYTCSVTSAAGTDSASSTVTVIDFKKPQITPPEDPKDIPIGDGGPVTMTIGVNATALPNTTISITCPTTGVPKPRVTWMKNGEVLILDQDNSIDESGKLTVKHAKESAVYTCSVDNEAGTVEVSSSVVVVAPLIPTIVKSDPDKNAVSTDGSPVIIDVGNNITSLTNTSITIRCPNSGVPKPSVSWSRDGRALAGEEGYDINRDGSLVIKKALTSGIYTCSIASAVGTDNASSSVFVDEPRKPAIYVPDERLDVESFDGQPLSVSVGDGVTTLAETTITVQCVAAGLPKPSITWLKNGKTVIKTRRLVAHSNGSLTISDALVSDSGEYSCIVSNRFGEDEMTSWVTVVEPQIPKIAISKEPQTISSYDGQPVLATIGDSVETLPGSTIRILCKASGVPEPMLAWLQDGQPIPEEAKFTISKDGSLTILNALVSDSATYACVARNRFGEHEVTSSVTIFEVQTPTISVPGEPQSVESYNGQPVEVTIGDSIETLENTTITVQCASSGAPEPTIYWLKDGQPITQDRRILISKNGSLSISKALGSDSGEYVCVARNRFGENQMASTIRVVEVETPIISVPKDPQTVKSFDGQAVIATIGDSIETLPDTTITLQCEASGAPEPSITWLKDGQPITQDRRILISKNGSLSISKALASDSGEYSCTAQNIFGESTITSTIRVVDVQTPNIVVPKDPQTVTSYDGQAVIATIGDSIEALADTTITVQCVASGAPEPSINWLKDRQAITQDGRISISENGSLTITKALASDIGEYHCVARNRFGENRMTSTISVVEVETPNIFVPKDPETVKSYDGQAVIATIGENIETIAETAIIVQCKAFGVPEPRITWLKDGQHITQDGRITISKNGSFSISEALASDSGKYACVARNRFGENQMTSTIRVVEVETPSISVPKDPQTVKSYDGQAVIASIGNSIETLADTTITVRCEASGAPEPRITWLKDRQAITQDGRIAISENGFLTITKTLASDSGEYSCVARNRFGVNKMTSMISVVEVETPSISVSKDPQTVTSYDGQAVIAIIGDSIETLPDTTITIQCEASGAPEPSITWLKDGRLITQDIRITISNNGSFSISDAVASDSGQYACVARNRFGENQMTSTIRVVEVETPSISVPKDPRSVKSYHGQEVIATIGDSVETLADTTITVQCEASGVPEPRITWLKDGQPITEGGRFSIAKDSLSISKAFASDSGEYSCIARNRFGVNQLTSMITVVEMETPSISVPKDPQTVKSFDGQSVIASIGNSVETLAHTTITVQCDASGVPEPWITWLKDGQPITEGGRFSIGKDSLSISKALASDSGEYSCVARNRFGANQLTSMITVVEAQTPRISAPKEPKFIQSYDGQEVIMNITDSVQTLTDTTITIQCQAFGVPEPSITWLQNGRPIAGMARLRVSRSGSLTISNASSSDIGEYTCVARNRFGENKMASSVVIVEMETPSISAPKDPQTVKSFDGQSVIASIGDSVETLADTTITLQCDASGVPEPRITWLKDGQPITEGGRFSIGKDSLSISKALASDSGEYSCIARNRFGANQLTSMITVVEAQTPRISAPKEPKFIHSYDGQEVIMNITDSIQTLTDTTITIQCQAFGVPEPSITWLQNGRPIAGMARLRVSRSGSLTISNASSSDIGEYTCVARNRFGENKMASSVVIVEMETPSISVPKDPQTVKSFDGQSVIASIGDSVETLADTTITVQCDASGVPEPRITWLKDGQPITEGGRFSIGKDFLSISKALASDSGEYSCIARNRFGANQLTSMITVVEAQTPRISAPKEPKFIHSYDGQEVIMNITDSIQTLTDTTITIQCQAFGVPEPSITWLQNGRPIAGMARLRVSRNGSLTISNASSSDIGDYTCVARNRFGENKMASSVVVVEMEKPSISAPKDPQTVKSFDGQSVIASIGDSVETLADTTITVQCDASGVPEPRITWLKDGQPITEGGRFSIGKDSISISKALASDSGEYSCVARNRFGANQLTSMITVVEAQTPRISAPKEPKFIQSYDGQEVIMNITDSIQTLTDTTITIQCQAFGVPEPSITWLQNGRPIAGMARLRVSRNGSLTISNASSSDIGDYTCVARNRFGENKMASSVVIVEMEKPSISAPKDPQTVKSFDGQSVIASIGNSVETLVDTTITVQCEASGVPEPRITWLKDGQPITEGGRFSIGKDSLSISKALASDSGEYSCVARNRFGANQLTSMITVVEAQTPRISAPKEPKFIHSYDGQEVIMNITDSIQTLTDTTITIQCQAFGVPEPSITWLQNGRPIAGMARLRVSRNGSLTISNASSSDIGDYTCVARNRFGENKMASSVVVVEMETPSISVPKDPQTVKSFDGQSVIASIGDSVETLADTTITVQCEASGVPEPRITWLKDGQPITEGGRFSIAKDSLSISKALASDSGEYSCVARNRFGVNQLTSMITVVEAETPRISAPKEPKFIQSYDGQDVIMNITDSIQTLTDNTITIQCQAFGVPEPSITWLQNGRPIAGMARLRVSRNGSLTISNASSSDIGDYTCVARNRFGENEMASSVVVVDPQAPSIFLSEKPRSFKSYDGQDVIATVSDSVETVSGTTITIQCEAFGVPNPSITWLKDGQPVSQDGRFTISKMDSLTFSKALVSDSGTYACVARNIFGENKITSTITIMGSPTPSISTGQEPQYLNSYDGQPVRATIGDSIETLTDTSITIQCVASGSPKPRITWLKDGQPITQNERHRISKNGSLTISKALISDSAEYACVARNKFGKENITSTVAVIASIPARIDVSRPGKNIPMGDGIDVRTTVGNNITELLYVDISISCPSSGFPKPVVTWKKNGQVLVSGETYVIDMNNTLTFSADSSDTAGLFTCMAENVAGKDAVSSLVDLEEPFAPIIAPSAGLATMLKNRRPVAVAVGNSVTALTESVLSIICEATGFPRPNVTWTKDGREINTGAKIVIGRNGSLLIRNLDLEDSGRYVCNVKSRAGQDSRASNIMVKEPLEPSILSSGATINWYEVKPLRATVGAVVRTVRGPDISLSCPTTGFPPPDVVWKKEGEELESSGSLLQIRGFQAVDAGLYTCEASNFVGAASASTAISVAEPSKPVIEKSSDEIAWTSPAPLSVPVGGSVDIEISTTLTLVCKVSGFPPPVVSWKRGDKPLMSDGRMTITGQSLSIVNARFLDSSEYTCTATNVLGSVEATTELTVRALGRPMILSISDHVVDVNTSRPVEVTIGNRLTTAANATVVVTCPTSGSPEPTITWSHNQQPVVTGEKYSIGERGMSLTMRDVQREDEGRVECRAANTVGNTSSSLNVQLAVAPVVKNLKGSFEVTDIRELLSITTGAVVTAPKGITIRIRCQAVGVPAPRITWFRRHPSVSDSLLNGRNKGTVYKPVRSSNNIRILDDESLSISSSKILEATEYVCVATNVAGRDEGTTVINIGVAPEIAGSLGRKAEQVAVGAVTTIVKGSTLSIRCIAVGTPTPNITWRVDSARPQGVWRILKDGTLQVPHIEETDEGNYTCIANNSYGIVNRTTTVSVLVPPSILERHFRHVKPDVLPNSDVTQLEIKRQREELAEVKRGQNVVIICAVSGKPKPSVAWQLDKRQIINDTRHMLMDSGVLLVRDVKMEESGQYRCVAENLVGKDEGSVSLRVKEDVQNVTGYWYANPWSKCGECVGHFRGYQTRNVSCVDVSGDLLEESFCSHHPKASARRSCFGQNCQLTWRTSAWAECSSSCGSDGVQSRVVSCVYHGSHAPAVSKCNVANKPLGRRECNRKPCSEGDCADTRVYCKRVKQMKLCRVYKRWCCKTCLSYGSK